MLEVPCYVLNNEIRVLMDRGLIAAQAVRDKYGFSTDLDLF
jgi:hypothetical protein